MAAPAEDEGGCYFGRIGNMTFGGANGKRVRRYGHRRFGMGTGDTIAGLMLGEIMLDDHNGEHDASAKTCPAAVAAHLGFQEHEGDAVGGRHRVLRGAVVFSAAAWCWWPG